MKKGNGAGKAARLVPLVLIFMMLISGFGMIASACMEAPMELELNPIEPMSQEKEPLDIDYPIDFTYDPIECIDTSGRPNEKVDNLLLSVEKYRYEIGETIRIFITHAIQESLDSGQSFSSSTVVPSAHSKV